MSTLRIRGGKPLKGKIQVPADKSMTHRALLFNAAAKGEAKVTAHRPGEDNQSTAQVLQQLGVTIDDQEDGWRVQSQGVSSWEAKSDVLDCGNSGTTIRLLSGLVAGHGGLSVKLTGDASLQSRPMSRITVPLRDFGASIYGQEREGKEYPPLKISAGAFKGGTYTSPLASAQVKSALLLAGLAANKPVTVTEPHRSRDHTERMLSAMGRHVEVKDLTVTLEAGDALAATSVRVPGDISSAAFWMVAGSIIPESEITLENVGVNPTRTGLMEILEELRASIQVDDWHEEAGEPVGTMIVRYSELSSMQAGNRPTEVSGDVIPRAIDELVVLAAAGARAEGELVVSDAVDLRFKESDRIAQTTRVLRAFGGTITPEDDGFVVSGRVPLSGCTIDVGADHRIALTAAVLALAAKGESCLENFDIAAVSYPGFVDDMRALGADVEWL